MDTKLDKKEELICKIKRLSASDIRMLKSFLAGMEAEHIIEKNENRNDHPKTNKC